MTKQDVQLFFLQLHNPRREKGDLRSERHRSKGKIESDYKLRLSVQRPRDTVYDR